jgi:hypothetical protein
MPGSPLRRNDCRYTMGEHTGSPLRCGIIDIIDNGNHGNDNVVANLCVRPIMCSPYITNLHRVRYNIKSGQAAKV